MADRKHNLEWCEWEEGIFSKQIRKDFCNDCDLTQYENFQSPVSTPNAFRQKEREKRCPTQSIIRLY